MQTEATTSGSVLPLEEQLAQLVAQLKQLQVRLQAVEQERDEYRKLVKHLREENERLKRGLLGQKAERLPSNNAQLTMSILNLVMGSATQEPAAPEPPQVVEEHLRRKPVRNPLPTELPRVHIVLLPPEVEREGTDGFECIGSDTREVLERRPAATVVVRLEYKKFVRKESATQVADAQPPAPTPDAEPVASVKQTPASTQVLVADTVELPIPRGTAGPAFLADTLVRRWQDHQPLNRMEGIYGREGLHLSKSTLCTWHEQLADLCRPLVEAMFLDAKRSPYLCADATGVLIQDKERCRHGHFWVVVAPARHVLYRYSRRHDKPAVDVLLAGYSGYLVVDAHAVYDHLFLDGTIVEVGCWCHCRRYFYKSVGSEPERAQSALALIGALFRIERENSQAPPSKRELVRKHKSRPLVEQFFRWCDEQAGSVLDESPLAAALTYARNQRLALSRYLDDGRLPMHNNASELHLRRQVLGRHNWLFCGSDDGAEVNTVFVSLLASCRLHHIEPLGYLRDLLCLLPRWSQHRLLDLAPVHWAQTLQEPQTQQLLGANPFRRAVLGLQS